MATNRFSVDPEFKATHKLDFKVPTQRTRVAVMFTHKRNDQVGPAPFIDAIRSSGAFLEVAEVKTKRELANYEGWNVIRIDVTGPGGIVLGVAQKSEYHVDFRLEFQGVANAGEFSYSPIMWAGIGGKTDAEHPLSASIAPVASLFAKELVLACLTEAQTTGKYFQ